MSNLESNQGYTLYVNITGCHISETLIMPRLKLPLKLTSLPANVISLFSFMENILQSSQGFVHSEGFIVSVIKKKQTNVP